MKLNKSILGTALMIVVLFSACSQARYGNMTRRVKTTQTVQRVDKPVKVEEAQNQSIVKLDISEKTKTIGNEVANEVLVNTENQTKTIETTISIKETARAIEPKVKASKTLHKKTVKDKVQKVVEKTAISKVNKQLKKLKVDQAADNSSLIRLLLIIILVLLIISLITELFGPLLNWLFRILLLIVLIWLILQLL